MTEKILKKINIIKKLVFPDKCPICGAVKPQWFSALDVDDGKILCVSCMDKIKPVAEPLCKKCGRPLSDDTKEFCADCEKYEHAFIEGRSLYEYEGDLKMLMYRFKYSNRRDLAEFFVSYMSPESRRWLEDKKIDMIVPIPLHPAKLKKRGYNQSLLFGKALSAAFGLKLDTSLLTRGKHTRPQKGLSRQERINNLKNAFILRQSGVKSKRKNILLVDDIYTTGATIDAAASALSDVGDVYFMCICSGAVIQKTGG